MAEIKLSYEYYHSIFNCGSECIIPPEMFSLMKKRATELVFSQITQSPHDTHMDAIRNAICDVAEHIHKENKRGGLKSESIDGYSVTYSDSKSFSASVNAIIRKHLGNTGLLFRGV